MASVKAQTVGLRAWPEVHHSGHRTLTYAVCFVVRMVVLMVLAVGFVCVFVPGAQKLCFGTYVLQNLCDAVIGCGAHSPVGRKGEPGVQRRGNENREER